MTRTHTQEKKTSGCQVVEASVPSPRSELLTQLNETDHALLVTLLHEPMEYIANERFVQADAETALFGGPSQYQAKGNHFRPHPKDEFAGLEVTGETSFTTEQEIHLFQRYNYSRYRLACLLEQHRDRELTAESIRELLAWGYCMGEIRNLLTVANLPLVLAMAKRTRLAGLDFNELISEGNFALLRSIDKFDCARGFKFSTYACRAILKSFSRVALRNSRYRSHFPTEFDPDYEKGDVIDRKRDNEATFCVDEVREIIEGNRARLNDVEQVVLRERFALNAPFLPAKPKTLEEVGTIIGVTKERVRQIQNKALKKLRHILEESLVT